MFGTLIRRKPVRPLGAQDEAFESTSFSLSTAVPRPEERRNDDRLMPMLRVAKNPYGYCNLQGTGVACAIPQAAGQAPVPAE